MRKMLSSYSAAGPRPVLGGHFNRPLRVTALPLLGSSNIRSGFALTSLCCRASETKTDNASDRVLKLDSPWEKGSLWSTMGVYMFSLHIPLSFGGLSIVSYVLRQPSLDPRTEVLSLLVLEATELACSLSLLKSSLRSQQKFTTLYENGTSSTGRSWILATAAGFGFLIVLVSLTSMLADQLWGPKFCCKAAVRYDGWVRASSEGTGQGAQGSVQEGHQGCRRFLQEGLEQGQAHPALMEVFGADAAFCRMR